MRPQAVAIRHVDFEDLGLLGPILDRHGFTRRYLDAPAADQADWEAAARADLLVVLGGPIGVDDEADHPFLGHELRLLGDRVQARRPTLGICLGAQLLAVACGGRVAAGAAAEIGWAPVTVSAAGADSVLEPLAEVSVLHWHGDVISAPDGAQVLAYTADCPVQAFSFGPNVLGLQFHLEADPAGLESWLVAYSYELSARRIDVQRVRRDAAVHGAELAPLAEAVLTGWLDGLTTLTPSASSPGLSPARSI